MKPILFLALMAYSTISFSQTRKWYALSKKDVYVFASMSISGAADGINQAVIHHSYGRGSSFSDYETSYKRKYKDYDAGNMNAAYPGSKTWLVWTTDLFHLSRTIDHAGMYAAIILSASDLREYEKKDLWKVIAIKKGIIPIALRSIFFSIIFNNFHDKKL